ncbi:MAG: hypothetical protein P4L45_03455 [Ignavibacteriaceae bacterium]|nr:hypothetical protein [Ignavibacteriaceae bacterium]
MNKSQPILSYTFSFLIIAVILKITGLLRVNNEEILAYTFILYGIGSVYLSLGKDKKFRIFLGTAAFLVGIIFFIINNFDIISISKIIFPSIILILGIACLMLYIDNTNDKTILYISLFFILSGLIYSMSIGSMRPAYFIYSAYQIVLKYWIIVIIAAIIFIAINRGNKNED